MLKILENEKIILLYDPSTLFTDILKILKKILGKSSNFIWKSGTEFNKRNYYRFTKSKSNCLFCDYFNNTYKFLHGPMNFDINENDKQIIFNLFKDYTFYGLSHIFIIKSNRVSYWIRDHNDANLKLIKNDIFKEKDDLKISKFKKLKI